MQALLSRTPSHVNFLNLPVGRTCPLKVFDMESCQRRLSGGYITLLLGVAAASDAGRELLANTELWSHLAIMGSQVRRSHPAGRAQPTSMQNLVQ